VRGNNDGLVADDHQVIVTSRQNNQLVALSEQNGGDLFNYSLNSGLGTAYPAAGGGVVFF
jgi:hypothetical protein